MNVGIWSDIILGIIGIAFVWFFGYVVFYLKETHKIDHHFDGDGRYKGHLPHRDDDDA